MEECVHPCYLGLRSLLERDFTCQSTDYGQRQLAFVAQHGKATYHLRLILDCDYKTMRLEIAHPIHVSKDNIPTIMKLAAAYNYRHFLGMQLIDPANGELSTVWSTPLIAGSEMDEQTYTYLMWALFGSIKKIGQRALLMEFDMKLETELNQDL